MKTKGFFGIAIALLFVILGYWLYFEKGLPSGNMLTKTVGLINMIFFGILLVFAAFKFLKNGFKRKNGI